jgi:hypothetical protein
MNPESKQEKYIFTYTDNKVGKVLFSCEADSILIADKLFMESTGINPTKNAFIGCSLKKATKE